MKKIIQIFAVVTLAFFASCGHKPDMEALTKKVKEYPTELTAQDYDDMIYLINAEHDEALKKLNKPDASYSQVIYLMDKNTAVKIFGERLSIALYTGKLNSEQERELQNIVSKSEEIIRKGKQILYK